MTAPISRTRTGTVETGGVTIEYRVVAATEDDRVRADRIESGIRHAINAEAVLPHTAVTYWHETEQTFTEQRTGRPTLRTMPDTGAYAYACSNFDDEEIA